jgi:hypothetical protein
LSFFDGLFAPGAGVDVVGGLAGQAQVERDQMEPQEMVLRLQEDLELQVLLLELQ